ncbi:hypothetical protein OEIGOIKO_00036 [Streptomyces chrestomyceticus JCM 4735]|uniref:Exo-alpha-sialidase n=1 Tax=Streptomyces chrestomyceticus JCM 4735 TaxID=1306181 RepID=A0A7U9KN53_9ACTN|nr:hypothetical protein [Streptomyces chrestomyceticus]GCD32324.1 hypothetical protein OEIGOIKO_00036 [Streptomyces chrestomyceticus JCM 4735]
MPLYMAWRGSLGDTGLWWSQSRNGITWTPQQRIFGAMSMERPALAAWREMLYLARREEHDQVLWWAVSDGSGWSGPRAVPGACSSHAPAVVAGHHGLHLYWKGPDSDERLFHAAFDGRFWAPGQVLFNGWPMTSSRPSTTTTHTTRTWLAFTGAGRDRTIRLCHSPDGTRWNFRNVLPGPAAAASSWPSVTGRTGPGRTDRLLLAWPDHDGAVRCALSHDAARRWSQPAPVPARTLRGIAFAAWDTADAYAAWAVTPDGEYGIFWADTADGIVWRHPRTAQPLQYGQGRLDERASLREPAMAACGHMWR